MLQKSSQLSVSFGSTEDLFLSVLRGVKQGNVLMSVWIWAKKTESTGRGSWRGTRDMTSVWALQKPLHCPVHVSIPALSPGDSHIPHHGSSGSFASSSWSSSPEISITSSHPSQGELAARPTELNLDPDILDTIRAFHFSAHKSVPFIPNPRRFCIMITKMKTLRTTLPRVILHSPSIRAILEYKWSHAS